MYVGKKESHTSGKIDGTQGTSKKVHRYFVNSSTRISEIITCFLKV